MVLHRLSAPYLHLAQITGINDLSALGHRWAVWGPVGQAQVPGRPTLLQFEKNVRIFFPKTSEFSEDGLREHHLDLEFI